MYKALWRNQHEIAVKTLKYHDRDRQRALDEADLMRKLRHDKIVKLYCVCASGEPFLICMEFMCHGSLLKWMRQQSESQNNNKSLTFNEIINIATQIASGMKYLSSHNYVHRDLAARNILVGVNYMVKIADFGLAVNVNSSSSALSSISKWGADKLQLAIKWTAPELLSDGSHSLFGQKENPALVNCTSKADVWSFGVVLYELITLGTEEPYKEMNNQEVMIRVKYDNFRMSKPEGLCTDEYYKIMLKCWSSEPEARDSFETLYNTFNDYLVFYET